MATEDVIGSVANTAILAGLSLAMIKQIYPDKYPREKARRARVTKPKARKVVKKKVAKKKKR